MARFAIRQGVCQGAKRAPKIGAHFGIALFVSYLFHNFTTELSTGNCVDFWGFFLAGGKENSLLLT